MPELTDAQVAVAHEWLAKKLAAEGKAAGTHSAAELADAYSRAMRGELGVTADSVNLALAEAGTAELVTHEALTARAGEIFAETGGGGREAELAASRQAIDELGLPGQPRRDGVVRARRLRDDLIDGAIASGAYTEHSRAMLQASYDRDPLFTRELIERMQTRPAVAAFTSDRADGVDGESVLLHERIEQHLAASGKATGYTHDDYLAAMAAIERADRLAAKATKP